MHTGRFVPLLALALAGAGCAPCDGEAEVVDPDGLLSEEERAALADTWADLNLWAGEGRVCVDSIEVAEVEGGGSLLVHGLAGVRVVVDPDGASAAALRARFCEALDDREGLSDRAPGLLDPEDEAALSGGALAEARAAEFVDVCACGVPDVAWLAEVEAACGSSPLSERDVFFATEVFPHLPAGRNDGALATEVGEAVRVSDALPDGGNVLGYAPLGDALLVLAFARDDATEVETVQAVAVDLDAGVATELAAWSGDVYADVFGGLDEAVVAVTEGDVRTLHRVDAATWAVEAAPGGWDGSVEDGVVGEGVLYVGDDFVGSGPVTAIDLATGDAVEIALPGATTAESTLLQGMVPAAGGFAAWAVEATVVVDGDATLIGVADDLLLRWDAVTGWEEVARDVWLVTAGATADGRMVGTLPGGAEDVLAAYDLATDRLLVSDEVCLAETERPDVVVGDRAWTVRTEGGEIVLTPVALAAP